MKKLSFDDLKGKVCVMTRGAGLVGSGNWCFVLENGLEEDVIEFIGTNGTISLPCFNSGNLKLVSNGTLQEFTFQNPIHISQNLVQQVVNELLGGEKCVSTGESAARTSWVLDEMVKEYYV